MVSAVAPHLLGSSHQPRTALKRESMIKNPFRRTRAFVFALALLIFTFTTSQCCFFIIPLHLHNFPKCHALSSTSMPSQYSQRTLSTSSSLGHRCKFCTYIPNPHQQQQHRHEIKPLKYGYSSKLLSSPLSLEEHPSNTDVQRRPTPNAFAATATFNHDIARTIFAPLFFSLHHYQKDDDENKSASPIRNPYQRPSPFKDPSCAQTAERMLRRMMENRYRSDGRTVCPDGRTFGLVAGAFGRLRCESAGGKRFGSSTVVDRQKMVTWEEELNIHPLYQNNAHDDDREDDGLSGIGKIQMTPIDKLQQLLQLQLQLCHREGWPEEIRPSVDMYNRIFKRLAWKSGSTRSQTHGDEEASAAEKAWLWLQFMKSPLPQNDGGDGGSTICNPDATSYSHIIEALSAYRAPVQSDSGKTNLNSLVGPPTLSAYKSIEVLATQMDIEIVRGTPGKNLSSQWFLTEADKLLIILEDEYSKTIEGENSDYGWNQGDLERALAHGYRCLLEGWGRYAVAGVSTEDSTSNNVGNSKSEDNREHAIKRAHELLGSLESLASTIHQSENTAVVPSSCYSSAILALSVSNLPSAANAAEDVLGRMMSQYGIGQPSEFNQHALLSSPFFNVAFSGCIAAHAKNNDAPKAEKILDQMMDLYDDGSLGREFVPEVRAFGTCIALWSKFSPANIRTKGSQRPNMRGKQEPPSQQQRMINADRAEAILATLEGVAEMEATKDGNFILHATPYNIAILARVQTIAGNIRSQPKYKKYNYDDNEKNEQIILHAQSILDHMEYQMGVTPDPYTYSILLNAWCQQSRPGREGEKAADYAEELLRRRIEDVDIGKICGDDTARTSSKREQSDIWPNAKHCSLVLKAHANTKSAGGAKKALALLSEMERRFYDANMLENDDSSADVTEYHVDQKDVAKPDIVCYSIVIDAFANSRLMEASSVAHRLLRAVETKYEAGDVSMKPNTRIYTAVILALVHSPFIGDEKSELTDEVSGKHTNNAQRAWSILERMKKNDATPNSFTYNYIINCAAQAGHDAENQRLSFEIALRAFQELRKGNNDDPDISTLHPDSFTYAFMLKACKNLLPPGSLSNKVMSQTFQECCRSGYLNDAVLDRLWYGVPRETFYKLLEERPRKTYSPTGRENGHKNKSPIRADELPKSWSRSCNAWKRESGRKVKDDMSWKKGVKMSVS